MDEPAFTRVAQEGGIVPAQPFACRAWFPTGSADGHCEPSSLDVIGAPHPLNLASYSGAVVIHLQLAQDRTLTKEFLRANRLFGSLHLDQVDSETFLQEPQFGKHVWALYAKEPGTYRASLEIRTACEGGAPEVALLSFEVVLAGHKCQGEQSTAATKIEDNGVEYIVGFYVWPGLVPGAFYHFAEVLRISPSLAIALVKPEPLLDALFGINTSLDPNVEFCNPNRAITLLDFAPNDPYYPDPGLSGTPYQIAANGQWGLRSINANVAWQSGLLGRGNPDAGRNLCIVDSGFFRDHEDFQGPDGIGPWRWLGGEDTTQNAVGYDPQGRPVYPADVTDQKGHGTKVTGIAVATINNGVGVAGVANVKFRTMKTVAGADQELSAERREFAFAEGIRRCVDADSTEKTVISLSLGTQYVSEPLQRAVKNATEAGALVVAAAGNGGPGVYPATDPNVVAVGCILRIEEAGILADEPCGDTSQGDFLDLVAPGRNILTTCVGDTPFCRAPEPLLNCESSCYGVMGETTGSTSASTPFVSGAAAFLWSLFPSQSAQEIRRILECSADDLVPGRTSDGDGRIDMARAFLALGGIPGIPPPACTVDCKADSIVVKGVDKNGDDIFEGPVNVTFDRTSRPHVRVKYDAGPKEDAPPIKPRFRSDNDGTIESFRVNPYSVDMEFPPQHMDSFEVTIKGTATYHVVMEADYDCGATEVVQWWMIN